MYRLMSPFVFSSAPRPMSNTVYKSNNFFSISALSPRDLLSKLYLCVVKHSKLVVSIAYLYVVICFQNCIFVL